MRSRIKQWCAPFLLATLLAAWSARGLGSYEFADPDASHHAMNGVLIHDWIASGNVTHPIAFARTFYSHLPAISIPYHPPLFPIFESLFYFAAGVHGYSARLAVAFAVFAAVLLLCGLLFDTYGSMGLALFCAAVTFLIPDYQRMSSEVMLEVPSLVMTLAALWCLWRAGEELDLRHAVAFGVLTGAAIWTKQHAIFLVAVPYAALALRRNWRGMFRLPVWVATAIAGIASVALAALARLAHTGTNRLWGTFTPATPFHNAAAYADMLAQRNGLAPALLMGGGLVYAVVCALSGRSRRSDNFYLAWAVSSLGLLLVLPFHDARYLFYAYVPLVVLTVRAAGEVLRNSMARQAAAVAALIALAIFWTRPPDSVHGTREAAEEVMESHPERVLYLGGDVGDFVFFVRERDPHLKTIIVRGDRLPKTLLAPDTFDEFVREHGIQIVVVEQRRDEPAWCRLVSAPQTRLILLKSIVHRNPDFPVSGPLFVYRVLDPAPHPKGILHFASDLVKTGLDTRLDN